MKIICTNKNRRSRVMASNPYESKRNAANPYMYFTKHGIGPGTLPKDVKLVNWEDLDDYMTQIWVDRPLSTKELDMYDIIPETRNTELMKKYGITSSTCSKRKFTVQASSISAAADNTVSKEDVNELVLYITNDGRLYKQMTTPIINNMKRKRKNGNYDDSLAVKGWQHLADEGVRRYDKEFGSGRGSLSMLNKATRMAIAEELKEYYEDEVSYEEQAVQSADDLDIRDESFLDALWDACDDIHNLQVIDYTADDTDGTEIIFIYENATNDYDSREEELINALQTAGYNAEYVDNSGSNVIALRITNNVNSSTHSISAAKSDDTKTYTITYDQYQDIITVDSFESEQDAVDKLIDKLEAEGNTGCFVDPDDYNEDEYVIGGNHGLALYHGGNFMIEETGSVESSAINAGLYTRAVPESVGNPVTDMDYVQKLADGVVEELNAYYDGGLTCFADISDTAITFSCNEYADLIYIQPLDGIIADESDLEDDITELFECVTGDWMPRF